MITSGRLSNIKLARKTLQGTNALAYLSPKSMTKKKGLFHRKNLKRFNVIKTFWCNLYTWTMSLANTSTEVLHLHKY